ncbi:hypothetical protein Pan161_19630 [Gimesia algae]|uniref:Uncharacterized protein n=1 Tax=Gimesia algae TaxID=2527971 RepID=A0A517VBC5_9PLAN|nr:hypothetical protein Pan161_19630 [Gimesia algae]
MQSGIAAGNRKLSEKRCDLVFLFTNLSKVNLRADELFLD